MYKPCLKPAQRQTDLTLYVMPYLPLPKALGILYTTLTTTILQVNPGPIIPPSSLTNHHEAIPIPPVPRSGPYTGPTSITHTHTDPTAKYKA